MRPRAILVPLFVLAALTVPDPHGRPPSEPVDLARLAAPPPEPVAPPKPKSKRVPFLSTSVDSPYPFQPLLGSNPERICDRLDEAGFANLGWRGAEIAGVWECMAQLDVAVGQADAPEIASGTDASARNSLFYLLRGRSGQRISYARLKLNLLDPAGEAETLASARSFMELFAASAGFYLPPQVLEAIAAKRPLRVVTEDVDFRLKPEFEDPARLNLSIEFGPTLYAFYLRPRVAANPGVAARAQNLDINAKQPRLRPNE